MHLQENTLFDLDLGIKVTKNIAQCPRHHMTYALVPAKLDIMLQLTVKEKMHLQESTLFDLDLWVKVTRSVAHCPLHNVTYEPTEFETTISKGLGGEAFTRKFNNLSLALIKVTQNFDQYPLRHVTYMYPATKFEAATSNCLGFIHVQENTLFGLNDLRKNCRIPSTSCDLFSSCYVKRLGGDAFTRKFNI